VIQAVEAVEAHPKSVFAHSNPNTFDQQIMITVSRFKLCFFFALLAFHPSLPLYTVAQSSDLNASSPQVTTSSTPGSSREVNDIVKALISELSKPIEIPTDDGTGTTTKTVNTMTLANIFQQHPEFLDPVTKSSNVINFSFFAPIDSA
jgi:hypothetical protein